MENNHKKIRAYDLMEIQNLLGCYQRTLEEEPEPDEFGEECRLMYIKQCDHLINLIEEALFGDAD